MLTQIITYEDRKLVKIVSEVLSGLTCGRKGMNSLKQARVKKLLFYLRVIK